MLIGHKEIVSDLKKLAAHGALAHGYIFCGPSMVGKRTVAQAFAHFLEGTIVNEPKSAEFEPIAEGKVLEDSTLIDIAYMKQLDPMTKDSIGIDAVREIKNFLWQKPNTSPRRTLIIDEAELLTTEAQNALLKVTEEPPASSLLILVTSDIESILPTIVSRLPKVYFGPVEEKEISKWIGNTAVAKKAMGKPGLAWRLTNDKEFAEQVANAEKFLKSPAATRRDLIKKIIDPDDFNLRKFLDAVIITLAWEKPSKAKAALWHRTLKLEEGATNFGVNPRLQLEALLA